MSLRIWIEFVFQANGELFIANQDDQIKTKNITEKITFDSVAVIMANAPAAASRK